MTKELTSYGILLTGIAGVLAGARLISDTMLAGWAVFAIGLAAVYVAYRMISAQTRAPD